MIDDIDHHGTPFPVCPFCGFEFRDTCDLQESGEIDCDNDKCGKEFTYSSDVEVTYNTNPKETK